MKPPEDEEAAKRRARAERFGIPLVEPKQVPTKKGKSAANGKGAKSAAPDVSHVPLSSPYCTPYSPSSNICAAGRVRTSWRRVQHGLALRPNRKLKPHPARPTAGSDSGTPLLRCPSTQKSSNAGRSAPSGLVPVPSSLRR